MEVRAKLNNLRISPRKVRLLAGVIRGLDVVHAKHQLDAIVKKSSQPLSKLLDSAVSNATNNFNLQEDNLFIKDVNVDEGPKLKRFRPKGFGRTSPIEKKTSHVRIVLEEKIAGLKGKPGKSKVHSVKHDHQLPEVKEDQPLVTTMEEYKPVQGKFEVKKPANRKEIGKRSVLPDFKNVKRLFRRKSV